MTRWILALLAMLTPLVGRQAGSDNCIETNSVAAAQTRLVTD